jgi:hypothetical protein
MPNNVTALTIEAVNHLALEEFAKFVKSAPYHTRSEMRGEFRQAIRTAILGIEALPFLNENPEVGSWQDMDRFELGNTVFDKVRSAVGERIWEKNIGYVDKLNHEMFRDTFQETGLQLVREITAELGPQLVDLFKKAEKRMASLLADVEANGITLDNVENVCNDLRHAFELVRLQSAARKDKQVERKMYRTADRVHDFCRIREHAADWLTPTLAMAR